MSGQLEGGNRSMPAPVYRGELSVMSEDNRGEESSLDLKALKNRFQVIGVQRWVRAFEESDYNPVQELINMARDPETSALLKANIDLKLAGMLMPKVENDAKSTSPIVNVVVQSVSRVDLA
jgi:hypothetical protein